MLKSIQKIFESDRVLYSQHARHEMLSEEFGLISDDEVGHVITAGEIIEKYADDRPYPSCLIFGLTHRGRPLHVVCALAEQESLVIVVTVYQPTPELWENYKVRKNK